MIIWLLGRQSITFGKDIRFRPGRRPKRFGYRQIYLLEGLPGIGPRLAIRFLEKFGTVERAITASAQERSEVEGVEKTKAEKIRAIVAGREKCF